MIPALLSKRLPVKAGRYSVTGLRLTTILRCNDVDRGGTDLILLSLPTSLPLALSQAHNTWESFYVISAAVAEVGRFPICNWLLSPSISRWADLATREEKLKEREREGEAVKIEIGKWKRCCMLRTTKEAPSDIKIS